MHRFEDDSLGFLSADISRLIRARMDRANTAAGIGVTPGEARVLVYAAHLGPVRQNRLAELIGIEAMTVSGYLDALEGKGLVARGSDPADRRAKIVQLRPEAGPVLDAIGAAAKDLRARMSAGFDEAEWDALKAALVRVRANLCGDSE